MKMVLRIKLENIIYSSPVTIKEYIIMINNNKKDHKKIT